MAEETTFNNLKKGLLELLDGYPSYRYFGKIEFYLRETKSSLNVLEKDGIIEFASQKEAEELNKKLTPEIWTQLKAEGKKAPIWYRLASKGVDLAISMINLEHSERMIEHSKKTNRLTNWIITLTIILIIFGVIQTIFTIL